MRLQYNIQDKESQRFSTLKQGCCGKRKTAMHQKKLPKTRFFRFYPQKEKTISENLRMNGDELRTIVPEEAREEIAKRKTYS